MIRFIHLTDLHLSHPDAGDPGDRSGNAQTLTQVITAINAMETQPAFVVASGDLTNLGDTASYHLLRDHLAPLKAPLLMALGNHDKRAGFYEAWGYDATEAPYFHQSLQGGLHVITLDTSRAGHVAGTICAPQFALLERALEQHKETPKIIVMHHPPRIDTDGLPWGSIDMASTERLAATLKGHQIAAILSGHIHINRVSHWHGIPIIVSIGLNSSVDLLETVDMRLIEGRGFGICDWRPSGMSVSFVPLTPAPQELGTIDRARLLAFT